MEPERVVSLAEQSMEDVYRVLEELRLPKDEALTNIDLEREEVAGEVRQPREYR